MEDRDVTQTPDLRNYRVVDRTGESPQRMDDIAAELSEQIDRWGQRIMETIEDKMASNLALSKDTKGKVKKTKTESLQGLMKREE